MIGFLCLCKTQHIIRLLIPKLNFLPLLQFQHEMEDTVIMVWQIYSGQEHPLRGRNATLYVSLTSLIHSSHTVIDNSHTIWNEIKASVLCLENPLTCVHCTNPAVRDLTCFSLELHFFRSVLVASAWESGTWILLSKKKMTIIKPGSSCP